MKLKTKLLSGAGNTFHISWNAPAMEKLTQQNMTRKICEKTPADGFIFLSWKSEADSILKWEFYNNDGSVAEMCGNATRCVGRYIDENINPISAPLYLETIAGLIEIEKQNNQFKVKMTKIKKFDHAKYFYCDTGVPHIVIPVDTLAEYKTKYFNFCRELRMHPDFLPKGTNVTLIEKTTQAETLKAVSYERGVEDFTQACGTGAMAAGFYNLSIHQIAKTNIKMPGGDIEIDLSHLDQPLMIGPAVTQGEFTYDV